MVWATQSNDKGRRGDGRSLGDLKIGQEELFARVLEGICPGCGRALEIRDVNEENNAYSDRCGWCELCLWGWSATVARGDGRGAWKEGAHLVTVYSQGALVEMSYAPDEPTFQMRFKYDRWL